MASIRKLDNGKYRVFYRDDKRRSRSKTFTRHADADRFRKTVDADVERGEFVDPKLRRTRFETWAERWWETTAKLSSNTRRGYWKLLTNHVGPHFGPMPLAGIDWAEVEAFIAAKLADGYSPKKVRDMVSVVSLIMKTAIRSGARTDNPAADHTIPQRRAKLRRDDILTMAEAVRLVEATRDPYKPATWLLVLLGLRPAELCGLKLGAVDFGHRSVHVRETLNAVHSFPGHDYGLEVGAPKTDAGDRELPIPQWLADDLAAMLADRADRHGRPAEPDDYLFLAIQERGPIRVADLRRWVIRPALEAAGLPVELRTYDLRHSHASMLFAAGANPLEVAHRMGHTDPAVTMRVYGHLYDDAQERLTAQLDQMREAERPTADGTVVDLDQRRRER